jgi:MFS family permease
VGSSVSLSMICTNFALVTEWMGLGFSYIGSDVAWRLFLGLQHVPPILMAVCTPFLPESPRFLIMRGRYDEALEIIKKLHGGAPGQDDDFYIREFNQIKAQHELEVRERVGLRTILSRPSYRKRMFIVVFQFAFAMFTGIIPLQNYQFILYTYLGVTNKTALVMVGVWGTCGTIFCIMGALSFDKLGRRKSLLGSLWVQFLASIAMVICKYLPASVSEKTTNKYSLGTIPTVRQHQYASRSVYCRLHVCLPRWIRLHHECIRYVSPTP